MSRRPGIYLFCPIQLVVSVQDAELTAEGMHVDGCRMEGAELELFALHNGFATAAEILPFFEGRELPIVGQLFHWTLVRYESVPALLETRQMDAIYRGGFPPEYNDHRDNDWLDHGSRGAEQHDCGPGVDYDPRC